MFKKKRIGRKAVERTRKLPYNNNLMMALHLAVWLGGLAFFTVLTIRSLNVQLSIYRSVVNVCLLAVLFYLNGPWLVSSYLSKGKYFIYYLLAFILLIATSELRTGINRYFELGVEGGMFNENLNPRAATYTISAAVLIVSTLVQLLRDESKKQQAALIMENQYQEAQLQFLKAQINPHFLFNSLNNIYALAILESKDTPKMILKLSNLLRYAIYEGQNKAVLLSKEWMQIKELIELFQMKAALPYDIQLEVIGPLNTQKIEPMLLIPLVENCLKHTDFELNEAAFVKLSLEIKEEGFLFYSSNSKAENQYSKDQVGGVGLQNIQARLDLNYAGCYQLKVENFAQRFDLQLEMPFYTLNSL